MSKSLCLVLLMALLVAPAATGQLQGTSTLTLNDLPAKVATNESLAAIPFTVSLQVSNMLCVGTGALVLVDLVATTVTTSNATFTTVVEPAQLAFNVPAGQATSYSSEQGATLTVRPAQATTITTNATTTITATISQLDGCVGATNDGQVGTGKVDLSFLRVRGSEPDNGKALPGPALPLLALALVALAVALRRQA